MKNLFTRSLLMLMFIATLCTTSQVMAGGKDEAYLHRIHKDAYYHVVGFSDTGCCPIA